MKQCHSSQKGFRKNVKEILLHAVTLDTFVEEEKIERVDLLKIDAEASEPRVLRGMQTIHRRDEPDIICEVLYGRTENELQEIQMDDYVWSTLKKNI